MKHTKGPWEVEGKSPNGTFTIRANKGTKDIAWVNDHFNEKDDGKPNANLIASAPEMKKALYDIIDFASDSMPNYSLLNHDSPSYNPSAAKQYDLMKKIVDIANRAIIKAEGSE